ncbi:protein brambleberry-like [Amblyomma americanum]
MHCYAVVFFVWVVCPANGFLDWFTTKSAAVPPAEGDLKDFNKDGTAAMVPFEMKTADDEFIQEGKKYGLQTSTLDVCHHKVLLGLKTSCSQLNEEELGKLSVRLLNCQSAVEGRPTYPCTDEMSLRDCTKGMDQHTWNTYHLISNRARAVCYNIRQQQFYAKTEMTVNKLVWTTDQQVKSMSKLEEEQQKVSTLTSQTLETMSSGQKALMQQQEVLKSSQQTVQNFVAQNLKELMLEKALIAAGQRELAQMTITIRKKLDAASTTMLTNEQQRQTNHRELLKDLSAVHDYAKFLQQRLEQTAQEMLSRQETAAERFDETLNNLGKINASIGYVQQTIETMRKDVDSKFGWLLKFLHSTGDQLSSIYCCVLHCGYLLVAMFLAAFLQFSMASRMFLLFIVPMNAVAEFQEGCSLGFGPLSILLAVFISGDIAFRAIRGLYRRRCSGYPALDTMSYRDWHNATKGSTSLREALHNGHNESLVNGCLSADPGVLSADSFGQRSSGQHSHVLSPSSRSSTPLLEEPRSTSLASTSEADERAAEVSRWLSESPEVCSASDTVPATSTPMASPEKPFLQASRKDISMTRHNLLSSFNARSRRSFARSPDESFASNASTTSNSSRRRCTGSSKSGAPCRATCLKGKDFCHHHC